MITSLRVKLGAWTVYLVSAALQLVKGSSIRPYPYCSVSHQLSTAKGVALLERHHPIDLSPSLWHNRFPPSHVLVFSFSYDSRFDLTPLDQLRYIMHVKDGLSKGAKWGTEKICNISSACCASHYVHRWRFFCLLPADMCCREMSSSGNSHSGIIMGPRQCLTENKDGESNDIYYHQDVLRVWG